MLGFLSFEKNGGIPEAKVSLDTFQGDVYFSFRA